MASFRPIVLVVSSISLLSSFAHASTIQFQFNASLQTGTLAGTMFSGTGSYDNRNATGIGEEFLPLTSLDFTLAGASFTRADIDQGGQAILENGVLSYFTAAFFPPPPVNTPLDDIAFGFGGPGVIGYSTVPGFNFGSGSYTVTSVPEPMPGAILLIGLVAVASVARARPHRSHSQPTLIVSAELRISAACKHYLKLPR